MEKNMTIRIININDDNYSYNLRNIENPPKSLYCLGNTELIRENCISIVGTRKSSNYGNFISKMLSNNLANKGYVIVSGFAEGIDTYAHIGALSPYCRTICVLASGFNHIYPKSNLELLRYIINNGGLAISEYEPDTKATPDKFPDRNRIISGLSNNVIVVEAGLKSGSLITANYAMEQGRNVYAVPGSIFSEKSQGTNHLILQGAIPLISIDKNIF